MSPANFCTLTSKRATAIWRRESTRGKFGRAIIPPTFGSRGPFRHRRRGICGPHSELFFDAAPTSVAAVDINPITQPSRFIEVSNIVTITHRTRSGPNNELAPLPQPLVEWLWAWSGSKWW